jgi:energy-coupling factor transport system permease protein
MQNTSLYLDRPSGLHRLHPLTKLALALLFLVAAASLPGLAWVLGAYVLVMLPVAAWGQILAAFARASLALIQGFFSPGEIIWFTVGPFAFTSEGLLSGLTVAGRLLLALGGTLILMLSTRPDHLMEALNQRGLPHWLTYIVLTALQIFPRFQDQARVILEAQQARGLNLEGNIFRRLRLLVPLIGPLILGSIVDVEERAMALEARAFSRPGPKTSLIVLEDSPVQRLSRWSLVLAALALVVWGILR